MIDEYKKNGFIIIDDFLPEEVANELESMYINKNNQWEFIDQYRDQAYGNGKYGKHKTDSIYFPKEDEVYTAKFYRSNKLELKINNIFNKYFKPTLKSLSQFNLNEFDVRCYKLDEGCHYRTHMDDYAGDIGCVYYLNKCWRWDWGGILHIGTSDDSLKSIFPKFNRIMIHDMKKFRFPHFIDQVTSYAKNPRYSIVSFNK